MTALIWFESWKPGAPIAARHTPRPGTSAAGDVESRIRTLVLPAVRGGAVVPDRMSPLERFLAQVTESCADDRFVELRLTSPATAGPVEKIVVRLIRLAGGLQLSVTERESRRDTVRNLPLAEGHAWLREQLGTTWRSAFLATTTGDWQLNHDRKGAPRLVAHAARTTRAPSRAHDQSSARVLDERANDWLAALGVVDERGRPRAGMGSKRQQIARYVELLAHLAHDCGWDSDGKSDAAPLTVVDVGCGKGHLTFGAWHLLHRLLQRDTRVIGVELREELVERANGTARALGALGIEFVAGDASSLAVSGVDAWIALHACDTATDHAIRRGIESGARLIAVAPCCHRELRPQLRAPDPIAPVMQHGAMAERTAEWVTDGLRALVLEWAGYRTRLVEFVGSEHTPRNLLIAGVLHRAPFADAAQRRAIDEFRATFGITSQALDPLLASKPSA